MTLSGVPRWARLILLGGAGLFGAVVLLVLDPSGALLFRIVGLIATVLFVVSIAVMLLTFRNARRLSPWALILSGAASLVSTALFFLVAGAPLSALLITLALLAGGGIGIAWSLTNLLFVDGDVVRARGTLWYLAIWGLSLALTQVCVLIGGRTPAVVALTSFLGLGLALGNSAGLLGRYRRARRLARAEPATGAHYA